ncbi:MAG: ATP-grasp domain-containing protein [Bacteriovorax sp.]|jgi:ribosomal protein S6--L-glutamate ligase
MNHKKYKTVIVASESSALYTTKRILMEAKKLKYPSIWINPYEYMLNPTTLSQNNKFGLYFHRTTGIRYDDFDLLVSKQHELLGYKISNSLESLKSFRDKTDQALFLHQHGLSPIKTISYRGLLNEKCWESISQLSSNEKFIIKMARGNQGIGVNLVNGLSSLKSFLETFHALKDQKFIIQPFIEHKKEWRVFVIKNEIAGIIERTIEKEDFRGNAKRSEGRVIKKLSADIEAEVLRGADLSGLDYCGVDIMTDKKNFYFLEMNPVPGFEQLEELSGLNIARELLCRI